MSIDIEDRARRRFRDGIWVSVVAVADNDHFIPLSNDGGDPGYVLLGCEPVQ